MEAIELIQSSLYTDPNLRAYYRFESGVLTTDSSPNGYTLSNYGVVEGAGFFGGGADFGSLNLGRFFVISSNLGITTGESCSFVLNVKLNTEITTGQYSFLVYANSETKTGYYITYQYNAGTRRLLFQRVKKGSTTASIYKTISLGIDGWVQIAMTHDGSNLRAYVDTELVGTTPCSGIGVSSWVDIFILGEGGTAFCKMDDVSVFDRQLTLSEIVMLADGRYSRDVSAKASIGVSRGDTLTAKGSVFKNVSKTATSKARIIVIEEKNIEAKASVKQLGNDKTISSIGDIQQLGVGQQLSAVGTIVFVRTNSISAVARITTADCLLQAKANILKSGIIVTISAIASIGRRNVTIDSKARVQIPKENNISAVARIGTCDRMVSAKGYIYAGLKTTLDSKRRILAGQGVFSGTIEVVTSPAVLPVFTVENLPFPTNNLGEELATKLY